METGQGRFFAFAFGSFLLAAVALAAAVRLKAPRTDPLEVRREQRLWRSGPLGRKWLEIRRKLP